MTQFSLDSLPARQMVLETLLNPAEISEAELEIRKADMHTEVNYYGALYNIVEFRSLTIFLDETREVTNELLRLISDSGIRGKRIHDAIIVATMQSHRVRHLITLNTTDFHGLGSIEVHSPDQLN